MLVGPNFLRQSPGMAIDPLSDILTFLDARCLVSGGFSAGGRWGVRFRRPNAIKFCAVTQGACWLVLKGLDATVQLHTGDVIFLKGDRSFELISEVGAPAVSSDAYVFDEETGMAQIGTGTDFVSLGGHVALDERRASFLLDVLPPFIHVPAASSEAVGLRWLLAELVAEGHRDRPGAGLAAGHLAQLMFVRVIRAHLAGTDVRGTSEVGWLRGLGDENIAQALRAMHASPGRDWSLNTLAKAAGLSRSVFAARFKDTMGTAPLSYLSTWRMQLATRALSEGKHSIATIAESLGYTSESAFSNAFKRIIGAAPKRFQSATRSSLRAAKDDSRSSRPSR